MAPKGKSRNEDLKQEDILQAVVIADSFNVRFGPITYKKPRALLPLVNVPLLDYTLEALAASGVQEVFVFCCHLRDQVREHIKKTKWQELGSPMTVTPLLSDSSMSMGDALREIDAKSLIRSDFILITGDIVCNMDLGQVVKEHKARTQGKDKSGVMTLLFKVAQPGHRSRSREDDMFVVEEGGTKRLLYFKKSHSSQKIQLSMDILLDHDDIITHNDLMDCHVCVCSPSVPTLFTDDFDYLTREDFVKGTLMNEEIIGNKIYTCIIQDKYAARVSNMQTYDAISKDVISRWTYPFVPDMFSSGSEKRIKYGRHNIYCNDDVTLARGCELVRDVVIGEGSYIGSGSKVTGCVLGRNCHVGENVSLKNSFLWDNVVVKDNCEVDTALLCSGVTVLNDVVIKKGVILAWEAVVGPAVTIAQGTQLMSEPQREELDDLNLSFGEDDREDEDKAQPVISHEEDAKDAVNYGAQSKAFLYKPMVNSDDDEEEVVLDVAWGVSASDSDERNSYDEDSDDSQDRHDDDSGDDVGDGFGPDSDSDEDVVDSSLGFNPKACMLQRCSAFYEELMDTLIRARTEKINDDNVILEINSLKHAYTVTIEEVVHSLPCAILEVGAEELGVKMSAQPQIMTIFKKNVDRYSVLLRKYIKNIETQLIAINGLGDFVIRHSDLRPRLPQLLNCLYDADIFSENAVLSWFNSSHFTRGSNEALRHAFLRKLVQPFVKWLQEAEEESSEEEDEDD